MPLASVIIPVLDHRAGLSRCLDALAQQRLRPDEFELVVVDNGPAEGAISRISEIEKMLVGFPNALVVRQPQEGSYAARNLGLAVARSAVLAFTDSDCLPEPDWLHAGVSYLERHPDFDAAAGSVEVFARQSRRRSGVELYELRHGFPQEKYVYAAGFGATANLFVRRATFERIGIFDATLRSGGDREWGYRLHAGGLLMAYVPDAVVKHPARTCLRELSTKINRITSGDAVLRQREGWSRLTWLRYALGPLRPPLRTVWRARQDPAMLSLGEVVRYGMAFIVARWVTVASRLRCLTNWP